MDKEPKNETIPQSELDLTEGELNRIFFGSEKPIVDPSVTSEQPSSKPKKLSRKNIPPVIPPSIPINTSSEEEETKRPQGRPKIWTPEKIEQLKRENAVQAEQRRKEKLDKIRLSKLSTQEPISNYETEKLINSAIKSKDEIEKQISEKRTILKNILTQKQFPFLRTTPQCKHTYKLHNFDTTGKVIAVCKNCSDRKEMSMDEWNSYLIRNRKKL